ncbi:PadR family transcriptional regulator [Candidatus Bathyarchaeota archaeon]|nr:MAG: PadR family transcriptional regulator [Candidatus Bathyarchaeota archaeon]
MSVKRLVSKLTKENLWIYILTELSRKPLYAYEIAKTLKNKYEIPVATVTTYVVLYKMSREGLITKKEESSPEKPERKYYVITEKGLNALNEGKKFLHKTLDLLEKQT